MYYSFFRYIVRTRSPNTGHLVIDRRHTFPTQSFKNRFFRRTVGLATNLSENEGNPMIVVAELPEGSYRNIISILLQKGTEKCLTPITTTEENEKSLSTPEYQRSMKPSCPQDLQMVC